MHLVIIRPPRFPSLLAVFLPLLGNRQPFGRSVFFVQRLFFFKALQGGNTMRSVLSMLALSTVCLGATALTSFAVTSEPQPPAGAPATSASPPSSATEQHEGSKHEGGSKQEAQERKAIKHTQQAITQGKAGNAPGLRKHAET